jgi:DNA-binding NtrC family response regulator
MRVKRQTLPVSGAAARSLGGRGAPVALRVVGTGRDVPLPDDVDRFGIGSDPANHLVLDDRYVSGFHCLLERRDPARVVLRDRQSRNGTFVNGIRVVESDVGIGSRIVVGGTTLAMIGARKNERPPALEMLVGRDGQFRRALEVAIRAAASDVTVLVGGESGTGKELVARLIHESSMRTAGPFVAVNCGAIPRELVESELFGHERGAFTGAQDRRLGVFEQAHGGTLFLDEIGELPLAQQPRLLRVLETRRLRRVGGEGEREVDVRIVAASHRDLRAAAARGDFRLDLFHRLSGVEVHLPALRERPGDVPLLLRWFIDEAARDHGPLVANEETLVAAAALHTWPGNVRELKNAVHRAAILGGGEIRLADLLPREPPAAPGAAPEPCSAAEDTTIGTVPPMGTGLLDDVMRTMMRRAIDRHGSFRRAAASLGMSKSSFHDRARRYGLSTRRSQRGGLS